MNIALFAGIAALALIIAAVLILARKKKASEK